MGGDGLAGSFFDSTLLIQQLLRGTHEDRHYLCRKGQKILRAFTPTARGKLSRPARCELGKRKHSSARKAREPSLTSAPVASLPPETLLPS